MKIFVIHHSQVKIVIVIYTKKIIISVGQQKKSKLGQPSNDEDISRKAY